MKKLLFIFCISCFVQLSGQTITTVAGNNVAGFGGDGGQATLAQLNWPIGVSVDGSGNIFIADWFNNRIRKVNTSGIITTFAGTGVASFSGDGGPANLATLQRPHRVYCDGSGNVYIADQWNVRIRKINSVGTITTVVGIGTSGFSGDSGPALAAQLNDPRAIVIDISGNIYIGDNGNNRVRKVNSLGNISTCAGTGVLGFGGDGGPATLAQLYFEPDVAVDGSGNLYIADEGNHRIRKVDLLGNISTVVGTGALGFGGDGGPATSAQLNNPYGLTFDALGNMYIADLGNNRVRKVNTSGIISTVAGVGTIGYSGDGGSPLLAELNWPTGVAVDVLGNLYIAEQKNNIIRKVTYTTTGSQEITDNSQINFYPNPANNEIVVSNNSSQSLNLNIFDLSGKCVLTKSIVDITKIDVSVLNEGVYILSVKISNRIINKKLLVKH